MICANITTPRVDYPARKELMRQGYDWLQDRKCKAFYSVIEQDKMDEGVKGLIQACGLGKLSPNILMMGYKADWQKCEQQQVLSYFHMFHEALASHLALVVLRVPGVIDQSNFMDEYIINNLATQSTDLNTYAINTVLGRNKINSTEVNNKEKPLNKQKMFIMTLPKNVQEDVQRFYIDQGKGTIDIWWLYDDGGLTLLIPHILRTRKQWQHCTLRVFALANKSDTVDTEQKELAELLSKFRIHCKDVRIIPGVLKKPRQETVQAFNAIVDKFRRVDEIDRIKEQETGELSDSIDENIPRDNNLLNIDDEIMLAMKAKNNRIMRLREFLLEHSKESKLIIMSLPIPKKNNMSPALYMAWLETLTKDMPPFLLVRGNQTDVLTFYS
jgi:solute carrier family 12 sodium/potassium/chloride transporter 2